MDDNAPVLIVGCPRSGTTLLRLLLNAHTAISIPEETWFFPQLYKELTSLVKSENWRMKVATRILELNSKHFPNLKAEDLLPELHSIQENDYPSIISIVNRTFANNEGKEFWGDKTPGYVLTIPLIKKLFPNAYVIHIIRDGRDAVESILKYWEVGPQTYDFKETVDYWKLHVSTGRKDGAKYFKDKYYELRFEDLVTKPKGEIQKLCNFLNIEFESQMLQSGDHAQDYVMPWSHHQQTKQQISNNSAFKWKQKHYSKYKQCYFYLKSGRLLKELGYDVVSTLNLRAISNFTFHEANKFLKNQILRFKIRLHNLLQHKSNHLS